MSMAFEARPVSEPPSAGWGTEAATPLKARGAQVQDIEVRCRLCSWNMRIPARPTVVEENRYVVMAHLQLQHNLVGALRSMADSEAADLVGEIARAMGWSWSRICPTCGGTREVLRRVESDHPLRIVWAPAACPSCRVREEARSDG